MRVSDTVMVQLCGMHVPVLSQALANAASTSHRRRVGCRGGGCIAS